MIISGVIRAIAPRVTLAYQRVPRRRDAGCRPSTLPPPRTCRTGGAATAAGLASARNDGLAWRVPNGAFPKTQLTAPGHGGAVFLCGLIISKRGGGC
jgi:hypothetical protein